MRGNELSDLGVRVLEAVYVGLASLADNVSVNGLEETQLFVEEEIADGKVVTAKELVGALESPEAGYN